MKKKVFCKIPPSLLFIGTIVCAQDWHVSPDGAASNSGSADSPWEIMAALNGSKNVAPGDTLWLKAGTYKHPNRKPECNGYEVKLTGTKDKPIVIRGEIGKRVTIDGGLRVVPPATGIWIRDIEIALSEPTKEVSKPAIPREELGRPWGGLEVLSGRDCKYINLVIHNNCQGMGFWSAASDSEVYGCIFFNNGWVGPDRGHGHCIYAQNKDGVKTISNCIMQARFDGQYTLHAYGSKKADCDHFLVTENICYERGPFLIGSGKPSHDIKALKNVLYKINMQIGYNAPENEDCEIRDNTIIQAGLSINKYKKAVNENNSIVKKGDASREPKSFFFVNKYDPSRAHLAIYNPGKVSEVPARLDNFTKVGEIVSLYDPKDVYGGPVWEGNAITDTVMVPAPNEFNVYVVKKASRR